MSLKLLSFPNSRLVCLTTAPTVHWISKQHSSGIGLRLSSWVPPAHLYLQSSSHLFMKNPFFLELSNNIHVIFSEPIFNSWENLLSTFKISHLSLNLALPPLLPPWAQSYHLFLDYWDSFLSFYLALPLQSIPMEQLASSFLKHKLYPGILLMKMFQWLSLFTFRMKVKEPQWTPMLSRDGSLQSPWTHHLPCSPSLTWPPCHPSNTLVIP